MAPSQRWDRRLRRCAWLLPSGSKGNAAAGGGSRAGSVAGRSHGASSTHWKGAVGASPSHGFCSMPWILVHPATKIPFLALSCSWVLQTARKTERDGRGWNAHPSVPGLAPATCPGRILSTGKAAPGMGAQMDGVQAQFSRLEMWFFPRDHEDAEPEPQILVHLLQPIGKDIFVPKAAQGASLG